VTFTQADDANYNAATAVVESVTAQKANETISFGPLGNKALGDPDFTVSATASSGLRVSFTASGSPTVAGNVVHLTGAGSATVTAHQAGDSNFNAAPDVPQSFTIAQATAQVTWATPAPITYGTALGAAQLNAAANIPGT